MYYVVCDFDSAEIIKGVIKTVEDDHIILAKDGITYWLDECDDIFESEEEAVAFIAEMKRILDARHNCSAFVIWRQTGDEPLLG
mgnify:CR=1 FL=1